MQFDHYPSQDEIVEALSQVPPLPGREDFPLVKYAGYVKPIRQTRGRGPNKKVLYVLYMCVDGRVIQAREHHAANNAKYTEEIRLVPPSELEGQLSEHGLFIVQMTIDSPLVGKVQDAASAIIGPEASGADETNPVENAITSVRGRVLGAMGYGIIPGSGIASADEVENALKRAPIGNKYSGGIHGSEERPEEASKLQDAAVLIERAEELAAQRWPDATPEEIDAKFMSWAEKLRDRFETQGEKYEITSGDWEEWRKWSPVILARLVASLDNSTGDKA